MEEEKANNGGSKTADARPLSEESQQAQSGVDVAALQGKLEEALASAKRWQADFMNYQMRVMREREGDRKFAVEGLLRELLPAVDAIQHCVAQLVQTGGSPAIVAAVQIVEKEVLRILAKYEVRPIEAVGKAFDPSLHDAFSTIETAEQPEDMVIEVLRPGYRIHDRVLRPSQVRVSRKPDSPA